MLEPIVRIPLVREGVVNLEDLLVELRDVQSRETELVGGEIVRLRNLVPD